MRFDYLWEFKEVVKCLSKLNRVRDWSNFGLGLKIEGRENHTVWSETG